MRRLAVPTALALAACAPEPAAERDPCAAPQDDEGADVVGAADLPSPFDAGLDLFPWPSDQYLVPDAATATGRRVALPADLTPDGLPPSIFVADDGFSRVAPILTWMPGGFDPATLPPYDDEGYTAEQPDSAVLLVESGTCARVPALVEIDANATDPAQQVLIVRAHRALKPATRYVVLLRDSLRTALGAAHEPSDAFLALRDGLDSDDPAVAAWRPAFRAVTATIEDLELDTDEVIQAWTFTTRSEEQVVAPPLAMQDVAGTASLEGYTLEAPVYEDDRALIYGTLKAPWFLDADKRMVRDADGVPEVQELRDVPFLVTIPRTVTAPKQGVLVGHGFFSSLEEPTYGNLFDSLERWQRPAFSTKFYGFAEEDLLASVGILSGSLDDADTIVHQQLQSHVNFTVLHRLATDVLADELRVDWDGDGEAAPIQPIDGSFLPYIGASNGGTQGLVMMTTSPVLSRGALIVPGGGWSHMLTRAVQWNQFGPLFEGRYGDPRELQLVMAMVQQILDPVDSLNYVEHLLTDRFPGRAPEVEALAVEAKEDTQVANLVTRWVVRTAGFPLITPSPVDVWGVETIDDPDPGVRHGYTIYDLGVPPNDPRNVPPPEENGTHGAVRTLEPYKVQVGAFLETGRIVHPCDGPCDPD